MSLHITTETANQVFLTQIDLDAIKTEDTKPPSEYLPDCLCDRQNNGLGFGLDVENTTWNPEFLSCCTVCLSTTNISRLPQSASEWLQTVIPSNYMECGVCTFCNVILSRATELVRLARQAQYTLNGLAENGELNIKHISKLKSNQSCLVSLAQTPVIHFGLEAGKKERGSDCNKTDNPTDDNSNNEQENFEEALENSNKQYNYETVVKSKLGKTRKIPKRKATAKRKTVDTATNTDDDENTDQNCDSDYPNSDFEMEKKLQRNFLSKEPISEGSKTSVTKRKTDVGPTFTDDKLITDKNTYNDIVPNKLSKTEELKLSKSKRKRKTIKSIKKAEVKQKTAENITNTDTDNDEVADNVTDTDYNIDDNTEHAIVVNEIIDALKMDEVKGNKTKVIADLVRVIKKGLKKDPPKLKEEDQLLEKYFDAKTVSFDEQRDETIRRKMSTNYEGSAYKCDICYHGFAEEKEYQKHLEDPKHPKSGGGLVCRVCDRECSSLAGFAKHAAAHRSRRDYRCKQCRFYTHRKTSARVHAGWHHGRKFACAECGAEFKRLSNMLSHVRVLHPPASACALCGFSFVGARGLRCHLQLVHKHEDQTIPEDGPQCLECDIRFRCEEALATHQRVSPRHGGSLSNQRPARGSLLNRAAKRPRRKEGDKDPKNLRIHHEDLQCEQCNERLHSRRAYLLHVNRLHSGCAAPPRPARRPALCHLCGKTFMSVGALAEHARCSHSSEAGVRSGDSGVAAKYECDVCGKTFQKCGSLTSHKNIHLGKRFSCPICGKNFNQPFNRDRHYTYVHSTIRDVKCDFCEKMFKNIAEKKMHTTYVHYKKPYIRHKVRARSKPAEKRGDPGVKE